MRIWSNLKHPLRLLKVGDNWIIAPKGSNQNVLINDEGVCVVFASEEEARKAYEEVKEHRKTIKYTRNIDVV